MEGSVIMGKLTSEVFNEACCDGGAASANSMSAQPCGCDPGAKWVCKMHSEAELPKKGGKMKIRDYEKFVMERSKGYVDLNYCVIALNGEAGEVAEWYKKAVLREDATFTSQMLGEELGDVLFYLVKLANLKGWSLKDLIDMNVEKLSKRHGVK
jgi:NTP pyrophosphatase (non-canonical NTP hydrolase)